MLVIVRHGRTAANASGLLLGRLDVPLDEEGERQAARLAAAVGPVDRVVSSPLTRARQTAAAFGAPVEVDERWIELDYGDYDGTPLQDVPAEVWSTWRRDPSFAPPGGESIAALGERVRSSLETLVERARSETVVVVSHVSPIKAAVAWALGVGDEVTWRLFVAPASLTRIALGDRGPVLHTFNEVAHL
ncbi:histidine phosphatase family protein [Rhabdothermincola sp.]|uniref:histidine phosphatase family protein n=1 Tax=Rhabdothermincola sp. TaxID=2820405 RepID=UPI002FDF68FA